LAIALSGGLSGPEPLAVAGFYGRARPRQRKNAHVVRRFLLNCALCAPIFVSEAHNVRIWRNNGLYDPGTNEKEDAMLDYKAVVVGRVGIISKAVLAALRTYSEDEQRIVPLLGLPPKIIYRVEDDGLETLTTDPVEVRHLTRNRHDATVDVIPVFA
jgi:hypothetical protein